MPELIDCLSGLGFPRIPHKVLNRASIGGLFHPGEERCGIYVWETSNGEIYAGLSVDIRRRYREHTKNHSDIVNLYFKHIPIDRIKAEEKRVIYSLENAGFRLRNKTYTNVSYTPTTFDEVMTPDQQTRWSENTNFIDNTGERPENELLRAKYHRNFQHFLHLPQANEILQGLQLYISTTVPAFKRSELYYWSCSCLPSGTNVVIRVNAYLQQIFCVTVQDSIPVFQWHLAKSPLKAHRIQHEVFKISAFLRYETIFWNAFLPSGGSDQQIIETAGVENLSHMLNNPRIKNATRLFNLRLMRKGTNLNYRSHCFDLADEIQ